MSIAIISTAAFYMGAAQAQMAAPSSKPAAASDTARYLEAFDRSDKNTDGKLSKDEADSLPAIALRFEPIDVDKDGFISKTEYLEALKP